MGMWSRELHSWGFNNHFKWQNLVIFVHTFCATRFVRLKKKTAHLGSTQEIKMNADMWPDVRVDWPPLSSCHPAVTPPFSLMCCLRFKLQRPKPKCLWNLPKLWAGSGRIFNTFFPCAALQLSYQSGSGCVLWLTGDLVCYPGKQKSCCSHNIIERSVH